jgi:methionyl-tRNA formyltransferase
VASGETVTGVTTMRLDAGLDTGDMLLAQVVPIGQEETAVDVYGTLAPVGAELMVETLRGLECETIYPQVQDHSLATLAPILKREDGWIDFSRTAQQIYDRWRGFQPWPGAHTMLRGKKLIVPRMHVAVGSGGEAGVLRVQGDALMVGCGGGSLLGLDEVQMEGKRRMSAADFLRGYQVTSCERLGL